MTDKMTKPEYMDVNEREVLVNKVLLCRQICKIPAKDRSLNEKTILKQTLEELGKKYKSLFYWMNHAFMNELGDLALGEDSRIDLYKKYLEDREFEPPVLGSSAGENQIRSALLTIYGHRTSCYGICADLTTRYQKIQFYKRRAKSLAKGIAFHEDTEWGGDSVYDLIFPEYLTEKIAELESLYFTYKVKVEQFDAAHESLSRVLTLDKDMPSDLPKNQLRTSDDSDESETQSTNKMRRMDILRKKQV